MTTVAEAYFLVRVGQWGEDELDDWAQQRTDEQVDVEYERGYDNGYKDGFDEGRLDFQTEALKTIKDL